MVTRREFVQKSALVVGSLAAGKFFVDAFTPVPARAAQVDANDPGLVSAEIKYPSTDGTAISAYVTRPSGNEPHPAILVIHEWDGITEYIRDVARRLAKPGYVALAPDLLSREGGTNSYPTTEARIAAGRKLDNDMITKDLTGGINYLKKQSFVRANRIGVIGFCWGGGKALLFTTRSKDLSASVIYYGENPSDLDDVKNISAPVLGQYGGADERITSAVPELAEAMKKYGKFFEYKVYPGAPHAFNSDTNPRSYREAAAKEAWSRTLEFFNKHLQS